MLLFGSYLLCLTSDGAHAIVWDKNTLGASQYITQSTTLTRILQRYRESCHSPMTSQQLTCSIPQPTSTKSYSPAQAEACNSGISGRRTLLQFLSHIIYLTRIRSTCRHTFLATNLSTLSSGSPITALAQSPAVDVIGIGFVSGECVLYDIRSDEKIMRVFMEGAAVRAIAFQTGLFYPSGPNICMRLISNWHRWTSNIGDGLCDGTCCTVGSECSRSTYAYRQGSAQQWYLCYPMDPGTTCYGHVRGRQQSQGRNTFISFTVI